MRSLFLVLFSVQVRLIEIFSLGTMTNFKYCVVVGDIKCLLDEILDAVENLTDGLLNSLCPLLKGVIQLFSDSMCEGGSFELLGLCLKLDLRVGL
jgi:hypothetical protein